MPYVTENVRKYLDGGGEPRNAGELNYAITRQCVQFLRVQGKLHYEHINTVVGALEGAKQEFYRRIAVPYEVGKLCENGDVYGTPDPPTVPTVREEPPAQVLQILRPSVPAVPTLPSGPLC